MGLTEEQKNERARATAGIKTFDSNGNKPYVFISYKSDDWKIVLDEVVRYMVDNYGLRVYFDNNFDRDNDSWVNNMKNAIRTRKCQAVLAFVSKEYMRSYACVMELLMSRSRATQTKHDKKLEIIPIIVDDSADVNAARSENGTRVEIKEWGAYSELLEDTAACRWLREPDMEGLKDKVEDRIRQKENLTEEDLSDVAAEILGSAHERRFSDNDDFAKERFYSLLKETIERCTTDVFDPELIRSVSNVSEPAHVVPDKEEHEEPDYVESEKEEVKEPELTTETYAASSEAEKQEGDQTSEESKEQHTKQFTITGDITFTLYGKEYTYNQSDMMLTFFAQVLHRHQDYVENLPDCKGMNCASAIDYTKNENRTADMPSYFRICQYFKFDNGQGVCIGTAYGIKDKLKKMAMLLDICGEDSSVFSSKQVELPETVSGNRGNSASITYQIYGETFTSSQIDMMGNIFHAVIERHPDMLEELADQIGCVAIDDYGKLPKDQRPAYFATLCVYDLNGKKYSIGGALGITEKLKQIAKLLVICGEDKSAVEVEGYDLPDAGRSPGRRKKETIDYFG